jgi:hypothetical protein
MSPAPDPYDDGIAIVLQLSRVARAEDLAAASALLERWLEHYGPRGEGFRNCGVRAELGSREITLWADRVREGGDDDDAIEHARDTARTASKVLPVAGWQVTSAEEPSKAGAVARPERRATGVQVQDEDAEPDAAPDPEPARSQLNEAATNTTLPPGLRPHGGWVLLVFGLRIFAPSIDPLHADALRSAVVLLGIGLLHIPSRHWCGSREHVLAALAAGCAAASLINDLSDGDGAGAWLMRAISAVAAAVWAVLWMRCGRRA